jgi:phenylalanine-4-hydroxylase
MPITPSWTGNDHKTWQAIVSAQAPRRARQAGPLFEKGLEVLGFTADRIPDLDQVNRRLADLTGWQGVYVTGLEDGRTFYSMLAEKKFPIGSFVRDRKDLSYTPEPDVVHDLYGHIPFFADKDYADFSHRFGIQTIKHVSDPMKFHEFERLYWFGVEFSLIKTSVGRRIFGAGILSSIKECEYALSDAPKVYSFDEAHVRQQEFRIDRIQKVLFELDSIDQLYSLV